MSKTKHQKRISYMKNWRKQSQSTLKDTTTMLFGKYRLKSVGWIKENDVGYYQWLTKTFKVEIV